MFMLVIIVKFFLSKFTIIEELVVYVPNQIAGSITSAQLLCHIFWYCLHHIMTNLCHANMSFLDDYSTWWIYFLTNWITSKQWLFWWLCVMNTGKIHTWNSTFDYWFRLIVCLKCFLCPCFLCEKLCYWNWYVPFNCIIVIVYFPMQSARLKTRTFWIQEINVFRHRFMTA